MLRPLITWLVRLPVAWRGGLMCNRGLRQGPGSAVVVLAAGGLALAYVVEEEWEG